jgi:hypothetical protein
MYVIKNVDTNLNETENKLSTRGSPEFVLLNWLFMLCLDLGSL